MSGTYQERVEALEPSQSTNGGSARHGFFDAQFAAAEIAAEADAALAAVRDLVEAALALDAYRVEADAAAWPDWDARFEALESAAAAYRAWAPSPDAGTGDGGD